MRKKQSERTAGFGIIGVVLIVVALAVIGLLAWRFYDASKSKTPSSTANHTSSGSSSQANTQTPPPKVDPYAGWQTYCDTVEKACFKYPSGWTIDPSDQNNIVSVTLENSTKTLVGSYTNYDTRDGFQMPYYTAALEDLSTPSAIYKVLGGFVASTATVNPQYKVVDSSFTIGLTVGQQASVNNTARFTFADKNTGHLEIYPTSANGMTSNQATTWFTTDDAKTALLIARSFYTE